MLGWGGFDIAIHIRHLDCHIRVGRYRNIYRCFAVQTQRSSGGGVHHIRGFCQPAHCFIVATGITSETGELLCGNSAE